MHAQEIIPKKRPWQLTTDLDSLLLSSVAQASKPGLLVIRHELSQKKKYGWILIACVASVGERKYMGNATTMVDAHVASVGERKYVGNATTMVDAHVASVGERKYVGNATTMVDARVASVGERKYVGNATTMVDAHACSISG